jgi:type VI secretion system protein ImpK
MTATLQAPAGKALPDLCGDLFAFALQLRSAQDPGDAEALRRHIVKLLERLVSDARAAGIDSAQVDEARYASCALFDEIVLGSKWAMKDAWLSAPLQMTFFQDFTAGEKFYVRLEAARAGKSPREIDLLEVYAQCLAVGFRGKYGDFAGMQKVADLSDQLHREIRQGRGVETRALSAPFAREAVLPERVRRLPVWVFVAVAAGLLLVLLFVLDTMLASQAAPLLADRTGGK